MSDPASRGEVTVAVATCLQESAELQVAKRYPVICDGGEHAFVVLVRLPAPPTPGLRFSARGKLWEVVQAGSHTRGPVAKPVLRTTARR